MPTKSWIKITNAFQEGVDSDLKLLENPDYEVKSMAVWAYNPIDVKQGEEELIFVGERKAQREITCDSFQALAYVAKCYLERCKRLASGTCVLVDLDEVTQQKYTRECRTVDLKWICLRLAE